MEKTLYDKFREKLINEKIISTNDTIEFKVIHEKKINGKIIQHYLANNLYKQQKFLIRSIKEKDYSYEVMSYLISLNNMYKNCQFPYALTRPFFIEQKNYIITTYLEGDSLDSIIQTVSNRALIQISDLINEKLFYIHTIKNDKYNGVNPKFEMSFAQVMLNKIYTQLQNDYTKFFVGDRSSDKLFSVASEILLNASYSEPTLLHMDIKPENIIITPKGEVHLIDFELSRFGDIDYEWTNILIKTLHSYNGRFKKYVLFPLIEKNFVSIEKALEHDKYKIYMLYLSINIYIYYQKCNRPCPKEIFQLINLLLKQLIG